MNKQSVPLELLTKDAGTQQRPLSENVVKEYMALMQDGVEFPPVEIVREGDKYYLVDGFHRVECHERAGEKNIYAYVETGSLKGAIWKSFGANKTHGQPLSSSERKQIVLKILDDPRWKKVTQQKIAKHVGVTQGRVSQIRQEYLAAKKEREKAKKIEPTFSESDVKQNGTGDTKSDELLAANNSKRGAKKKTKKEEKKPKEKPPLKDTVGQDVPENLRELYASREFLNSFVKRLKNLHGELVKLIEGRDPAVTYLNQNSLLVNYRNLARTLKAAMFVAVCPYCKGQKTKCKVCVNTGLLNELRYTAVLKELKPQKKGK